MIFMYVYMCAKIQSFRLSCIPLALFDIWESMQHCIYLNYMGSSWIKHTPIGIHYIHIDVQKGIKVYVQAF